MAASSGNWGRRRSPLPDARPGWTLQTRAPTGRRGCGVARQEVEYTWELAFRQEARARVQQEIARRAERVKERAPELADEVDAYLAQPLPPFPAQRGPRQRLGARFRWLRLEAEVLEDLERRIVHRPLGEVLEGELRRVQRRELDLERAESEGAAYLRDPRFWDAEVRAHILERLLRQWAHWNRQRRRPAV